MIAFFRKLFGLRENEGAKVFQFALLVALLQAGLAIGISAADGLFITHVGARNLPYVYIIMPVMMLVYIPISAAFMSRFGIDRLFDVTLCALIVGGGALFAAMSPEVMGLLPHPNLIYYVAKLYTALWYIAMYTLVWNFIDSYFDILDAKRFFALFSAGISVGTMFGGGLVPVLVRFVPVNQLFGFWSIFALAAVPVLMRLRRSCRKLDADEQDAIGPSASFLDQAKLIMNSLWSSRFAMLLILVFFSTLVLTTLCEFQYMRVFERGRTAAEVTALLGKLYFAVNCFNLIVNLFLFSRLVAIFGVRNMTLFQPITYAIAFSYFFLDFGFGAAMFGFFAFQGILTSVEYNNQNFLFNALPTKGKAVLRTFIEGLCEPVATAAAGVLLLLYAQKLSPQTLSVVGIGGTVVAVGLVLALRGSYVTAMITNLRRTWLDFSSARDDSVAELDPNELGIVIEMTKSADCGRALTAIRILRLNDPLTAMEALLAFLDRGAAQDHRMAAPLLGNMLGSGDSETFQRVLLWLETAKSHLDPLVLEECGRHHLLSAKDIEALLRTGSKEKEAAGAVALWNSWKLDANLRCIGITNELINGTKQDRLAAIRILGKSGHPRYAHFLARFLRDSSAEIRRQALESMSLLVDTESVRLLEDVLRATRRGNPDERMIGLEILGTISNTQCIRPLVMMADLFSSSERGRAEALILDIGLESVPVLMGLLDDPQCPLQGRSIVARTLAKLSFPQFESLAPGLVVREIENAYEMLCAHWVLSPVQVDDPALRYLARFYADMHTAVVEFVLELLTISGQMPDFEMIASSLNSKNPKDRGNAIETISQACSLDIFKILLPLVDSRDTTDRIDFYLRAFKKRAPDEDEILTRAMDSMSELECAAALQAAWRKNPDSVLPKMHERLLEGSLDIFEDVAFSLLLRRHVPDDPAAKRFNIVERAYWISQTRFFAMFRGSDMGRLAARSEQVSVEPDQPVYRKGAPGRNMFVLVDGSVTLQDGAEPVPVSAGDCFGVEAMTGARSYDADAVSDGSLLIRIPKDAVIESAHVSHRSAVALFANKLGIEDVA